MNNLFGPVLVQGGRALFVVEVQVQPLGREAVGQKDGEARLLHPQVLAHEVERDGGVELAQELSARAAGHAELALQLLAVDRDSTEVLVTLLMQICV